MRRACGLLAAAFLLAFVLGLSPHLVHHLFEAHEHGAAADACPFATAAERVHPDTPASVELQRDPGDGTATRPVRAPAAPWRPSGALAARAPPTAAA